MLGVYKELSEATCAIEAAYNQYYLESDVTDKEINTTDRSEWDGSKMCISYGNGNGDMHFIVEAIDLK